MSNTKKSDKPFKGKAKSKSKSSCSSKKSLGEKLTTVSTTYARIVLLLMTVNFALTGYAVYSITQIQSTQMDSTPNESTSQGAQVASTEQ
tara:strand:+ start:444 stop:713 length:270 start_codon:yes stop_codon:yes gene_type:complete